MQLPKHIWKGSRNLLHIPNCLNEQINKYVDSLWSQVLHRILKFIDETGFYSYGAWTWLPGPDESKPPSAIHDSGLGG